MTDIDNGLTVSELMEITGKTRKAIASWLSNHKIKPLSYEARYPSNIVDDIKNAKVGHPKRKDTKKDK